jgi:hypothetical protein
VLSGVAATTSHHDRDELDRAFVRLLLNHLNADSVTLLGLLDDGHVKRVLRKVIGTPKEGVRALPSLEAGELLLLADVPAWEECVTGNRVVKSAASGGRWVTHFPIPGEHGVLGILAVDTATPLRRRAMALVRDVLQIIKNQLILLDYGELDTLTGLLNRRLFAAAISSSASVAKNSSSCWSRPPKPEHALHSNDCAPQWRLTRFRRWHASQ